MSLDDESPTEYFGPGAKLIHIPGVAGPLRVDPDYGQHLVERHEGAWLEDAPPIDALTADGGWRVGPSPELIAAENANLKIERGGIKWPNGPVPHPEPEPDRATVHLRAALKHAQEQRGIHRQTIAIHEEAVTFLNDHIAHIQQRIREAEGK